MISDDNELISFTPSSPLMSATIDREEEFSRPLTSDTMKSSTSDISFSLSLSGKSSESTSPIILLSPQPPLPLAFSSPNVSMNYFSDIEFSEDEDKFLSDRWNSIILTNSDENIQTPKELKSNKNSINIASQYQSDDEDNFYDDDNIIARDIHNQNNSENEIKLTKLFNIESEFNNSSSIINTSAMIPIATSVNHSNYQYISNTRSSNDLTFLSSSSLPAFLARPRLKTSNFNFSPDNDNKNDSNNNKEILSSSLPNTVSMNYSSHSSRLVQRWLIHHGFDSNVCEILRDYQCSDLFSLTKNDAKELLGKQIGIRLFHRLHNIKRAEKQNLTFSEDGNNNNDENNRNIINSDNTDSDSSSSLSSASEVNGSSDINNDTRFLFSPRYRLTSSALLTAKNNLINNENRNIYNSNSYRAFHHFPANCFHFDCQSTAAMKCFEFACRRRICHKHAMKSLLSSNIYCSDCYDKSSFCTIS